MPSLSTLLRGISLVAFFPLLIYSENDKKQSSQSSTENNTMAKFNINNISTFIYNNGLMDMNSGNSGFEYPLGSNKHLLYISGLMWGGLVNEEIKVGGSFYRTGLSPGSISANGQPEPPNTASVRVFRVRRDYKTGDLTNEMSDEDKSYEEIYSQYDVDWNEWPAEKGAPYEDLDSDGLYNPNIDIPGEPGALQTLWFSANDFEQSAIFSGKSTKGIEVQTTVWGYKLSEYIDNTVFRRYRIINKGRDTLENAYLSLFIDMDIGDATDDLVGCDSSLNFVYGYNSDKNDSEYGIYAPAAGFILLQGPIVKGTAFDIADFKGRKIKGMKNLPMTSSSFALKHGYDEGDFGYDYPDGAYNYMQGLNLLGEQIRLPERLGGGIAKFIFSGDPATLEGWVDGIDAKPGDRRSNISSGPFTFAPADTQEVVYACIAAGYIDKLSSVYAVNKLKLNARIIKSIYKEINFTLAAPQTSIFAGDREIALNWEKDIDYINKIENNDNRVIEFEGYNIYQAPSLTPEKDEIVKIAVFDLANGIKKIYHPSISAGLDAYSYILAQDGNDNGIKRYMLITKDSLSGKYLRNGSKYYFAVTSYYVDKKNEFLFSYETPLNFIEVIPESKKPGIRYGGNPGDRITAEHAAGLSDNSPIIKIIDPSKLNGHDYEITFFVDAQDSISAVIKDITAEEQYPLDISSSERSPGLGLNGLNISLIEKEGIGIDYVESLYENLIWSHGNGFHLEGYYGAIGWSSPRQKFGDGKPGVSPRKLKKVKLRFMNIEDTNSFNPQFDLNDPDLSFAYRYGRNFDKLPARPEFVENIINANPGFSYQDFKKSVPFSAWDIDDSLNPRRLAIAFLENNVNSGLVDGKYWPPTFTIQSNTADTSACEWIWILDEDYTDTPNALYQGNAIDLNIPSLYWITAARGYANFWIKSTMTIYPNRLFNETDVYRFVSPQNTYSAELAKEDVNNINVFPNPYYGSHYRETSQNESFITFNHLPEKAVIRIYNLGGQLVRTIHKNSKSQYEYWDLMNENSYQVGSGLFIAAIEMPDLGRTKVLKFAVIQKQIIPKRF